MPTLPFASALIPAVPPPVIVPYTARSPAWSSFRLIVSSVKAPVAVETKLIVNGATSAVDAALKYRSLPAPAVILREQLSDVSHAEDTIDPEREPAPTPEIVYVNRYQR